MVDFKKMDDKDFVFVNNLLTKQEEKEFSNFLKERKTLAKASGSPKKTNGSKKKIGSQQ